MDNLLQDFENEMSLCDNEDACLRRLQRFKHILDFNTHFSEDEKGRIFQDAINIFKTRLKKFRQPVAGDGRGKHRSRKHRSRKHRSRKHRSRKHRSHKHRSRKHRRPRQRKTTNKR